jgi:DNA-binding CsgD family transcriptional regulator
MTLRDLYRAITHDTTSHQRAIHARYLHLDPRRRRIVDARVAGRTLREIADAEAISHGSVQSVIDGAMERIRKDIAGEPRYNRTPRKGEVQNGMSDAAAAPVATPNRLNAKRSAQAPQRPRRKHQLPV